MGFDAAELSRNRFLGGKLNIWQPLQGYRAGADPVFLAASVAAKPGQSVLELGCGGGVASLCLASRVGGLILRGIELQADYAALARRNAEENGIMFDVVNEDLRNLPAAERQISYDHIFANPPYFQKDTRVRAADGGRETALAGDTDLAIWIEVAARRLKPGGSVTFIQKSDRLPELLAGMTGLFGGVRVKPLTPRTGRDADLVIVSGRKGAKAPFRMLAPLILHDGDRHNGDGENYSAGARSILRDGHALEI